MIKLSASVSKKLPVPEIEFSSQSYSAGMEVEISSGTSQDDIMEKLNTLYSMLEDSIDEQMGREKQGGQEKQENSQGPTAVPKSDNGPGTNKHNGRKATEAQVRAIWAIGKERGYGDEKMKGLLSAYGVEESSDLSISQASRLIDALKNNGKESWCSCTRKAAPVLT